MHPFQSNESRDIAKCDDVTSSKPGMISTDDEKIEAPSAANNIISTLSSCQEEQESGSMAHDEHVRLTEDEQSDIFNKEEDNVFMLACLILLPLGCLCSNVDMPLLSIYVLN